MGEEKGVSAYGKKCDTMKSVITFYRTTTTAATTISAFVVCNKAVTEGVSRNALRPPRHSPSRKPRRKGCHYKGWPLGFALQFEPFPSQQGIILELKNWSSQ